MSLPEIVPNLRCPECGFWLAFVVNESGLWWAHPQDEDPTRKCSNDRKVFEVYAGNQVREVKREQ